MKPYRLYFVEVKWDLGWLRVGQTENKAAAYEFKRRQEAEGMEVRIITKTY